jgi:hypothetical protein
MEEVIVTEIPRPKNLLGKIKTFLSENPRRTKFIAILALAIAIPLTTIAALTTQNLQQHAAFDQKGKDKITQTLSRVEISLFRCSNQVAVNRECQISALAYDSVNKPIYKNVDYTWGISSVNSIGTLGRTRGNIAGFYAKTIGVGDIWVIAQQGDTQVQKSITIEVIAKPMPSIAPTRAIIRAH